METGNWIVAGIGILLITIAFFMVFSDTTFPLEMQIAMYNSPQELTTLEAQLNG